MAMLDAEDTALTARPYQGIDVEYQEGSNFEEIQDIGRFRPTTSRLLLALALLTGTAMVAGYTRGFTVETAEAFYLPFTEFTEPDPLQELTNEISHVMDNLNPYPFSLPGFDFFPHMNSQGNNIKKGNGTIEEIAKECYGDPICMAFNSEGWMKHSLKHHINWTISYSDSASGGLFTKMDDSISPLLDMFKFFHHQNSPGSNIKKVDGSHHDIAKECFKHPNCTAFNTDGWMKNAVKKPTEWRAFGSDPKDGLFIRAHGSYENIGV